MGEKEILSSDYSTPDSFLAYLGREKEKNLSEIAAQREAVIEAQRAALASDGTTREQGIAMALLGALPVLIGLAARGKRGASMGGEAGTGAVGFYAKGLAEEEGRKRKIKLLEAEAAKDLLKQELSQQAKLEGLEFSHLSKDELKRRYPSKGPTVNIVGPESPLPDTAVRAMQPYASAASSTQSLFNEIQRVLPPEVLSEFNSQGYFDENGEFNLEGAKKLITDRLKGYFGGRETDWGKVDTAIKKWELSYARDLTGLTATDKYYEKLHKTVMDSGVTPDSFPVIVENLMNLQRAAIEQMNAQRKFWTASKSPGGASDSTWDAFTKQVFSGFNTQKEAGQGLDLGGQTAIVKRNHSFTNPTTGEKLIGDQWSDHTVRDSSGKVIATW